MVRTRLFRRRLKPGLISCAGTMDGWVRSSSTESLVLCKPFFAVFLGPVVLCVFTSCFRLSAVMTSLVDTRSRLGWEPCSTATYPWIVWPSHRFLWEPPGSSGLQHCNSRPCRSFFTISSWQGKPLIEGAWLSEDIYVLAQGLLDRQGKQPTREAERGLATWGCCIFK